MTVPFIRARTSSKKRLKPSPRLVLCAQRSQRKPEDTLIHDLRLVVRHSRRVSYPHMMFPVT